MEPHKFELYSPVINTLSKALGVVVKIDGDNVTVHTAAGGRATFKAQYLEPAGAAENEILKTLTEQLKKDEEHKKGSAPKIVDPELIRSACGRFIRNISVRYPKSGEAFEAFWKDILAATGDHPGKTWDMKPGASANPCPMLKICNPSTQKLVTCMNFLAGYGLRMEIKKEFLPPGRESLFPIDNAMFGSGRAVELNYKELTAEKRAAYIDCRKAVYANVRSQSQQARDTGI